MTDLRQAAQQALEALERYSGVDQRACDAEDALRQAIEQAEKQEPKCVVILEVFGKDWRLDYMSLPVGKHKLYTQQYVYTTPPAAQQEPTPWRDMIVASLVREGIDKHRARELADHFAAQPEQEPCIGKDPRCPCNDGDACHFKDCGDTKALPVPVAQLEQKPVAFYHPHKGFYWAKPTHISAPTAVDVPALPLYVKWKAAQRPWVGLTEEDWEQIHNRKGTALDTFAQGAVWAETQLRERNK